MDKTSIYITTQHVKSFEINKLNPVVSKSNYVYKEKNMSKIFN